MQWIKDWLKGFKDWLLDGLQYVLLKTFGLFLDGVAYVVEAMPVPEFITEYSLGDLIDPDILWMLHNSGVSTALLIVSSAIVFRVLRRLLTLGIW